MRTSLLLVGLLALAGCGGGGGTDAGTGSTVAPAVSPPVSSPVSPVATVPQAFEPNVQPPTCDAQKYPDLVRVGLAPATHTVVFVDRSSTATDTSIQGPYGQALMATLANDRLAHGMRIDLYTIHDQTKGKADHGVAQVLAKLPGSVAEFIADQQAACNNAMQTFRASRDTARDEATRFFQQDDLPEALKNGSDVWGAFQVVTEAAKDDPADRPLHVLFLSDMMHCRSGQRCLETNPPANAAQARAWGAEDAAQAQRNLMLDKERLSKATYTIVAGEFALKPEFEFMPAYWRSFLDVLGVPTAQITFGI